MHIFLIKFLFETQIQRFLSMTVDEKMVATTIQVSKTLLGTNATNDSIINDGYSVA